MDIGMYVFEHTVNTSMDCIFSVAHDRWLVIRSNDTSLCPIDNSSVKIRAAGKLYEPDTKYSRESLLDDGERHQSRECSTESNRNLVGFLDADDRNDYFSNNVNRAPSSNVRFAEDFDTGRKNLPLGAVTPGRLIFESESSRVEQLVLEASSDSLNDNSTDERIQLVLRTASDDTLDILDEANCENDIIPPPSDFATEMIPLRKSKSAPAPFKKAQKGVTPIVATFTQSMQFLLRLSFFFRCVDFLGAWNFRTLYSFSVMQI